MNKIIRHDELIYTDNINKDINIIHFADLHFNINTKSKNISKLKEAIIKNNPDYIMISGDLLDDPNITKNKYKIKELLLFLTDIATYSKVLISLGNHDIFRKSDFNFFDKLNALSNIYVLNNTSYKDENIFVSGITLPSNYYYNMSKDESVETLIEELKNNKLQLSITKNNIPKIALIHSPIKLDNQCVLNELKHYDLILSGHTHNGMIPNKLNKLFKNNIGLIAPNKKLFPNIAKGKLIRNIKNKKITIIINGGITKLSLKSSKILSKLNFIYNMEINKITITKKRGIKYE